MFTVQATGYVQRLQHRTGFPNNSNFQGFAGAKIASLDVSQFMTDQMLGTVLQLQYLVCARPVGSVKASVETCVF